MENKNSHITNSQLDARKSLVVFLSSKSSIFKAQREINNIFSNYSFYPEIEWAQYGYRPPEGYQVLGAWRQNNSKVFAFLLDNPHMVTPEPGTQLILHIAGDPIVLLEIEHKFTKVKNSLDSSEKKIESEEKVEKRLDRLQTSRPIKLMLSVLSLITAIINAISLYLRKVPPPDFHNDVLSNSYNYFLITIHFSALASLLVVIIIFIVFFVKYGLLIIRKM